jgi:predicted O-methyltransferase YrrM
MSFLNRLLTIFRVPKRDALQGYLTIEGWLSPAEANGLYELAASLKLDAVVVEIGSWKGKSTYCIAQGLRQGVIHCIDPFNAAGDPGNKEIYEKAKGEKSLLQQFQENLATTPPGVKINTLKGYSTEFVGKIKNIDFLFIDGDHSVDGCRFDFEHYATDLKPGGFLAFHDYYPERKELGPTWVIDNLVRSNPAFIFYKNFDTLSVFKKITEPG